MKTKQITMPGEAIFEAAQKLTENDLYPTITGTSEDGEIIIEVSYEKEDRMAVFETEELIDDYYDDEEQEDDDEEDDDDDDDY